MKNWQKIGILVGSIAVVLVIATVVVMFSNGGPKLEITFDTNTSIPSEELTNVREALVNVVKANTSNFDKNTVYKGTARDYQETVDGKNGTANFIVDFDSISESYKVAVTWPNSDGSTLNIAISCPLLDSKYPETPCLTEVNDSSEIVSYLPYEGSFSNGKKYKIEAKYDGDILYLQVTSNGGDLAGLEAAKKWVDSLPAKKDDILYYVPSGDYVQANHANTKDTNVNKYLPYFIPGVYNIYPVVDDSGKVISISADLAGCTSYQTDPLEAEIKNYLETKGINYPLNFSYCME